MVGLSVLCHVAERGLPEHALELGEPGVPHPPFECVPCALCPRLIAARSDAIRFFDFFLGAFKAPKSKTAVRRSKKKFFERKQVPVMYREYCKSWCL